MKNFMLATLTTAFSITSLQMNSQVHSEVKIQKGTKVVFEENKGQVSDQYNNARPDVLFSGESDGLVYHLKQDGISYQMYRVDSWREKEKEPSSHRIEDRRIPDQISIYRTDINWIGANDITEIEKGEALPGYHNYYLAVCPEGVLDVQSFESVTYKDIYQGIDLKYYDNNGKLEYDFIVAPGEDYKQVKWTVEGAKNLIVNENGELIISTPFGQIIEHAPIAYQGKSIIESEWDVEGNIVSFKLEDYNDSQTLIIDPVVRQWGSYYGASSFDEVFGTASDASENVYTTGITGGGTGLATSGAHQTSFGGGSRDAFVFKMNGSGVMQWATFYGGPGLDEGRSVEVDGSGNIFITGVTESTSGISSSGAYQSNFGGGYTDGFLVKLNGSGQRQWGTYYGGNDDDEAHACAADASGNVYVVGQTKSTSNISSASSHQNTIGGGYDAFLAKFNGNGGKSWSTYFGGSDWDFGYAIDVTSSATIYIGGRTQSSTGIATSGAHISTYSGGNHGFLAKFSSSGNQLWGTYFADGGTNNDVFSCVVDGSSIYICGFTQKPSGLATSGAHQTTYSGGSNYTEGDGFLAKFSSSGSLQWATYYGGSENDKALSCVVDASSNVYIVGYSESSTNISSPGSFQEAKGGGYSDAFIAAFNSSGQRLWASYYGGSADDEGHSCSTSGSSLFIGGYTESSSSIATLGSFQSNRGGFDDGFLVKFAECQVDVSVSKSGAVLTANASPAKYQWLDCDNGNTPIPGDTNQTYTATKDGNYAVVIYQTGCIDTSDCINIDMSTIGLTVLSKFQDVLIYPNPVSSVLFIEYLKEAEHSIRLINPQGQVVKEKVSSSSFTWDVSDIENGMYLIRICRGGNCVMEKIVKLE